MVFSGWALPYQDYSLQDDYVFSYRKKRFVKMDKDLLAEHLSRGYISGIRNKTAYQTITTRGCPHNCTYCCNNSLRELYKGNTYLRRRSIKHILGEFSQMRTELPFVDEIGFSDDSFFVAPEREIRAFAEKYKADIDLPFFCLGSPTTITEEKMEALTSAGLYGIQMGIQTGSTTTQKMYKRKTGNKAVLKAANVLKSFQNKMIPPTYDIIIDNPYETYENHYETFSLLLELPKPHRIQIFSLVLFPETELYKKALSDGLIDEKEETGPIKEYHHRKGSYSNLVFALFARDFPRGLLRILSSRIVLKLFTLPLSERFIEFMYSLYKSSKRK